MRVAVTGTPGTGKTTATDLVDTDLEVVHLNEVIEDRGLYSETDPERGSYVADIDAIRVEYAAESNLLVESHLAHLLDIDRVIVLRCHPRTIRERLLDRGEATESAAENAQSEALDVILAEAVERHGEAAVYEIETTDRSPETTAQEIEAAVAGEREPSAGTVDYTDFL